ncbi:hypothetical protein B0O99DRAFT_685551 [Bisporella sp. PMI_857]|nr:hypothetical protein B0O99DRAFT_685551 [Bisporella sp. PMI_857]
MSELTTFFHHAPPAMPTQDHYSIATRRLSPGHLPNLKVSSQTYCKNRAVISEAVLTSARPQRSKRVKWTPDVVDNEGKTASRKVQSTISGAMTSLGNFTSSPRPVANSSVRVEEKKQSKSLGHQRSLSAHHSVHQGSSSNTEEARRSLQALPAQESNTSKRRQRPVVPPRVPDAPNNKPPPAPRPSRLATPDLSDVEESTYFPPLATSKSQSALYYPQQQSAELRMKANLDAARAYMASRK